MTHLTRTLSLITALSTLAACGGAGGGGDGGGPILDEPTPPTITAGNVSSGRASITNINNRRDTPVLSILPLGSATYAGRTVVGLNINGEDSVNGMIGTINLTAQLAGPGNDVTGSIGNIHTLNGTVPVEKLSGQLAINGSLNEATKLMTSSVSGQLSGVLGDGERGDLNISGSMNGRTQDTRVVTSVPNPGNIFPPPFPQLPPIEVTTYDEGTGIAGTFSGSVSGSETGSFSGDWAVSD